MNNTSNTRKSLFAASQIIPQPSANAPVVVATGTTAVAKPELHFDLLTTQEGDLVTYGDETLKRTHVVMDKLLERVTKGSDPVLFELFGQLQKGIEKADLGELEKEIRDSQGKGFFGGLLVSIGATTVAKRMQKVNERIASQLTSKSKTISELVRGMETKVETEVARLIADANAQRVLADEFRQQIEEYGLYVKNGKAVLDKAKEDLKTMEATATASGDPVKIEESRIFAQKIALFENRLLILETALVKAPKELEVIRISQGAIWQTTSEVASSSSMEFADIKSTLLNLAVSHQLSTVQGMSDQRRQLRDSLSTHGTNLLEKTSVAAAEAQGNNRLADAQKLLATTQRVVEIRKKVEDANKANEAKFAEARVALETVSTLIKN